jgi:hypothetical protein
MVFKKSQGKLLDFSVRVTNPAKNQAVTKSSAGITNPPMDSDIKDTKLLSILQTNNKENEENSSESSAPDNVAENLENQKNDGTFAEKKYGRNLESDKRDSGIQRENNNRKNNEKGNETGMDNGRTMVGSALQKLVGRPETRSGIYHTIEAGNTAGGVSTVYDAEELEELESRGINPYWDKTEFRRELTKQAAKNGVLLDKSYLNDKKLVHDHKTAGTSENDVYLNPDGKILTKVNNLSYIEGAESHHNLTALIDRLAVHNTLFPNVAYEIKGFIYNKDGYISLAMEQPYVDAESNATKEEIERYLTDKGFKLDGTREWSNGHPVWSNGEYELFDARPANVLKGKDGNLYFIDTFPHSVEYMRAENGVQTKESGVRFQVTHRQSCSPTRKATRNELDEKINFP